MGFRRTWRRVAAILLALALIGLAGYTVYVGFVGSDQLIHPDGNRDCRTPLVRYGWPYEAINYQIADDAVLQLDNPDMANCSGQGTGAGNDVVTSDGIRIAGWYIPAANGTAPDGTTVVLVHGWAANKSEVMKYAVAFHDSFNVVAFDLRNGGRSSGTETTFGVREQLDLEAVIDWLERTKHPAHIAVMGNSMGGAAAVLAAATDSRIEALILDSMHARVVDVVGRRLEVDAGHPSLPGTPAVIAGIWLRTGINLMDADPMTFIAKLGTRPLLLIHGTADAQDLPYRSAEANLAEAQRAGVPAELRLCEGGTHGLVIDKCPDDWARWSNDFLDRAFQVSGGGAPLAGR